MIRFTILDVPPGSLIMAATDRGPSRVILTRRRGRSARALANKCLPEAIYNPALLPDLQRTLHEYFSGKPVRFDVHFDPAGLTPFCLKVLRACARIPYGRTETYGQLARQVGNPGAARAVGRAMSCNPVPIIIPCHRVITAQGRLGGFSAEQGVGLKRWLLQMEARAGDRL
jgi:methylated-DNA-[protein]-cysteine S-methyltransferase